MKLGAQGLPTDEFIFLKKIDKLRDAKIIPRLSRATLREGKRFLSKVQIPPNGPFTK
jgi:hypothetical protein